MSNDRTDRNHPRDERQDDKRGSGYNTLGYYKNNRGLNDYNDYNNPQQTFPQDNSKYVAEYESLNSGKYENYKGGGYYGSGYGSINNLNTGRDYEQNAGYRDSYNRLTTGQWPEVERAAQQRGFNLQEYEQQQRGLHKGKGPRSYQRSDARIREDIHDLLLEDPYVDATDIDVEVQNGEVILTGMVDNRNTKRRVEDIIEQVSGVKHFENRLRVRRPGGQMVNIKNAQ